MESSVFSSIVLPISLIVIMLGMGLSLGQGTGTRDSH